jgi:DNA ligase-1
MTFADFAKHLSKIEATPKRLEITDLLVELIKQTNPEEVEKAVNLSLGQLVPLYKDIDFNMAEKMMIKAVAESNDINAATVLEEFKKSGDLGETVEDVKKRKVESGKPCPTSHGRSPGGRERVENTIADVYEKLLAIALDSGENSQERKIEKTSDLLRELSPLSAKYAVRIILGNLRLGFSDRTVLDALSKIISGDKSARKKLEEIYNVRPDIGWMASKIQDSLPADATHQALQAGRFKIQDFRTDPQLGTPILPSLCQRLEGTEEIVEKMGMVAAEPKWDGQRIQAHVNLKGKPHIQLFTRGLENVAPMFPDLVSALSTIIHYPSSIIFDGEVVAFDPKTNKILPFQTMITRKRKYDIQKQLLSVPIRYMVFDIMYLDGKSLMNEPFEKRRSLLSSIIPPGRASGRRHHPSSIIHLAPQLVSDSPTSIRDFLKAQIDLGLEGIVAKRLDSPYSPGRTGFSWVKLKWEGKAKSGGLVDTIDCVVMGIYAGQGKRAGFGAGAFLVGVLSDLSYLTISKIGTGLSDEQWRELKVKSEKLKVKSCPKEYDVPKELAPDTWLKPELVVEIQADNITVSPLHTAGFALRFPRLVRYRGDKSPQQTTTVEEVKRLYEMSLEH